MSSIKLKKIIVITLLMIMQMASAAQGVTYFRVIDGIPHLPVFG